MKTQLFTALLWLALFSPIFGNTVAIQSARPDGICVACAIPTGLSASNQTGTTALLSWSAVPGAGSYWVEVENGSGNPNFFKVTTTVSGTSFQVVGLTPNLNYKFKVRSKCSGSKSGWTEWFSFNASAGTGGGACGIPGGMVTSNITLTSATLSWDSVPGVSGYRVNIEKASGSPFPFNFTVNLPSGTTSYTVTGLLPGRSYKWKVRSLCGSQTSDWSPRLNFTTPLNLVGNPENGASALSPFSPKAELRAFPNPTSGQLVVHFSAEGDEVTYSIANLLGKTLTTTTSGSQEETLLDLSALPAGMYLLLAESGSTRLTQKITIRK